MTNFEKSVSIEMAKKSFIEKEDPICHIYVIVAWILSGHYKYIHYAHTFFSLHFIYLFLVGNKVVSHTFSKEIS